MFSLARPGWPDEARLTAQFRTLRRVTRGHPLTGRCLNAGCGEGLYGPFIDSFPDVTEVTNVDVSGAVARFAHLPRPRYSAADASLTALPFPDGWFDSGICTEVLEHIPDDRAAARELGRCIRSGGRLLLSVPHPPAPFDPAHVREGYTLPDLTALLEPAGFRVAASGRCMSAWMSLLLRVWRWQWQVVGRGRRNLMPRAVVRSFGLADRWLPVGHRWDLVVMLVRE